MNLKELKEMIKLMNEHNLLEIEVEREGEKIRLRKALGNEQPYPQVFIEKSQISSHPQELPNIVPELKPIVTEKTIEIKSPMVGTFYRAPAPDVESFVEVGQMVEVGQVVCIIEAMKLMNEIKSEVKGKVTEIMVNNGDPIQFGQVLFVFTVE
ncbi:MAG: acetyl-CoA carboxylase biotin carboxyl carrier protein [Candidatus Omnitrophota bacterium]